MRGRGFWGRLAHVGAITTGVIVGERVFGSARSPAAGPIVPGIVQAGVETFVSEAGLAADRRLALLAAGAVGAVVGFTPPRVLRIRGRPALHAVRLHSTAS